jgi:uncharacterized membrane protein SirB2
MHRLLGFCFVFLTGCSAGPQAPSFLILNSYFPSWLIASLFSLIIVIVFRFFLIKTKVDDCLPAAFFFYVACWLIVSMAITYFYSPR